MEALHAGSFTCRGSSPLAAAPARPALLDVGADSAAPAPGDSASPMHTSIARHRWCCPPCWQLVLGLSHCK